MEEETYQINEEINMQKFSQEKHGSFMDKLKNDPQLSSYLMRENNLYILEYAGNFVGYLYIDQLRYFSQSITLSMGLSEEFRSSEKRRGIGSYLLNNISEYLLNNEWCDNIILELQYGNQTTSKWAQNANYEYDFALAERFLQERYHEIPYVRTRVNKK